MTSPTVGVHEPDQGHRSASVLAWKMLAVLGCAVTAVLYAQVSRTAIAPRTPWDENGVLQMSRLLAGQDVTPMISSGYYPGWSLLISPIWWFTDDPALGYRVAVTVGILVALATIWPLAVLGRQLGLTTAQGVSVGTIVMCLPARSVHADYALSEPLLMFCVAWLAVAVFAWWRRPSALGVVAVVVAGVAAYLTHARAVAIMLTLLVWLLLLLASRPRHAVAGLVTLGAGYVLVQSLVSVITEPTLVGSFGKEELMSAAISSTTPALLAKVSATQTFAQLVASFGLVAVGVVVIVRRAVPELTSRRAGPYVLLLGLTASAFLMSFLWWSGPRFLISDNPRFDVWVYTRYIDPVAALVLTVALAAFVTGIRRSTLAVAAGVTVLIGVLTVFLVAPDVPTWGGRRGPGNAAGILHWARFFHSNEPFEAPLVPSLTNQNQFWLLALLTLVGSFAMLFAVRRHVVVFAAGALALAVLAGLAADPSQFRDPPRALLAGVEEVEELADDTDLTIAFDRDCPSRGVSEALTLNWIAYWFAPRTVDVVNGDPDAPLVVTCDEWPEATQNGARPLKDAINYGHRLWIMPGALQDRLAGAGRLGAASGS